MKSYPDLEAAIRDALELARSMTYKYAVAALPSGGGKAVLAVPPDLDATGRYGLLRRYGTLVHQLGGFFQTGPDVGTSPAEMDIIAETGAPYIFARTPSAGGAGDSGPATALGVFTAIEICCEQLFGSRSLRDRRVLVQGAGSVGGPLMARLIRVGAEVLFSDLDPARVDRARDEFGLLFVHPDDVYDMPCDIFSPCALGGVLNEATIPRLQCRAIAGAANNQLARSEDAERLRHRQILYAPDFAVNIGGAMALMGMEAMGWSRQEAETRVVDVVTGSLRRIFDLAESDRITTIEAARRIAEVRLAEGKLKA
jgi:glutamate dehydrogenase/leucine dehydrogenase